MLIINSAIQYFVVGILAVAGGYAGSLLHQVTMSKSPTIRAERFELVERSGRVVSYWGPDGDRNNRAEGLKGALLVFLDSEGIRRLQLGADSSDSPHVMLYDKDGPADTPKSYDARPRFRIQIGETGSPAIDMRGSHGDKVILGAHYGDVSGEQELGWGLHFAASKISATASIGYSRGWDGTYQSGISITDGAGKKWATGVGGLKPLPLKKRVSR